MTPHSATTQADALKLPILPLHRSLSDADTGAHLSTPIHMQDGSVCATFCSFSFVRWGQSSCRRLWPVP